jgi:hypothetical protein
VQTNAALQMGYCRRVGTHTLGPQQIRGSCSPESQSTMRLPPKPVVI